jgi:hypothetical protein
MNTLRHAFVRVAKNRQRLPLVLQLGLFAMAAVTMLVLERRGKVWFEMEWWSIDALAQLFLAVLLPMTCLAARRVSGWFMFATPLALVLVSTAFPVLAFFKEADGVRHKPISGEWAAMLLVLYPLYVIGLLVLCAAIGGGLFAIRWLVRRPSRREVKLPVVDPH